MRQKKLFQSFFRLLKKISPFFLFFLFLFSFLCIYHFFQVKVIEIEGEFSLIDFKSVLANRLKNKNLLFLSEKEEEKKIKNNYPYVEEVFIKKSFPDKIFVQIKFYSPMAVIKNSQGFFILSSDGRILQTVREKRVLLPTINYYQLINSLVYKTGDWLDFYDLKVSLKLIKKMEDLNLKINTVDIENQDMILFNLNDNQEIVFTSKKEVEKQFFPIPIILRQLKVEGRKFKRIDVRFDKPIIKF